MYVPSLHCDGWMTRSDQEHQTTLAILIRMEPIEQPSLSLHCSARSLHITRTEGDVVKLTSGEIWISVGIAICVAIILTVLWLLIEPVLRLDVI